MPEKPATVAAYAAGASLAAVALFYVFGPNFTIDGDESTTNNGRKKSIVGLSNPANDCFINSVLQALAGLGELRLYIIRELHRRQLEGKEVYDALPALDELSGSQTGEQVRQLQQAPVTKALKEMLDGLNERPIYKKTISARGFIYALEVAFQTRISRSQQDAHEFLQVVVERLCDECHAGVNARKRAGRLLNPQGGLSPNPGPSEFDLKDQTRNNSVNSEAGSAANPILPNGSSEYGFPLEGRLESQIECQFCHYKYKPNPTSFVNLTLQVPQQSSATLSSCFDSLLKTEHIDDFRCENCELVYALGVRTQALKRARSEKEAQSVQREISLIKNAIDVDPETPPPGVFMPDSKEVPRRKIARYMRITTFPKIIAVHLSRSIFDLNCSTKNAAKVSFPERLPLGSILDRKWYKLLAIVCHKGSHNSGHYESFRRNHVYAPFSTPDAFSSYAQSRAPSRNPSVMPSPRISPSQPQQQQQQQEQQKQSEFEPSPLNISSDASSTTGSTTTTTTSTSSRLKTPSVSSLPLSPRLFPKQKRSSSITPSIRRRAGLSSSSRTESPSPHAKAEKSENSFLRRRKRQDNRWWRISDEKVKECKTSDVLGMQREVYLLFYELERPSDDAGR